MKVLQGNYIHYWPSGFENCGPQIGCRPSYETKSQANEFYESKLVNKFQENIVT